MRSICAERGQDEAHDEAKTQAQGQDPGAGPAKTQVCDARSDIQKQVNELRGLTVATATVDGVTANLKAIRADLGKIKDAQGGLSDDRKQQVMAASQAFAQQVTTTVKGVGKSQSTSEAATQVQTSLTQQADSYKKTLGQIDCA